MAYVRLGTTTTHNIVEFLVFDDEDKQCATIYYAIGKSPHSYSIQEETIGDIPDDIMYEIEKFRRIAKTALRQ